MRSDEYMAGRQSFDSGDYEAARQIWYGLADQGDAHSQWGIGLLFANGYAVSKDTAEATRWFERAAETSAMQGGYQMSYELGSLYATGVLDGTGLFDNVEGLPRDDDAAAIWIQKAVDQETLSSKLYYLNARSELWFRGVDEKGYTEAQYWLALSEAGKDIESLTDDENNSVAYDGEEEIACRWARAAAEQGHAKACMLLCEVLHDYYFPHPQVWEECAKWYRRGRELGHPHDPKVLWFGPWPKGLRNIEEEINSIIVKAKKGSLWHQRLVGEYYAGARPPEFEKAFAWLTIGLSHAFGDKIPEWVKFEDSAIRTWRLLDLVLEGDERQRADSLAVNLRAMYPQS